MHIFHFLQNHWCHFICVSFFFLLFASTEQSWRESFSYLAIPHALLFAKLKMVLSCCSDAFLGLRTIELIKWLIILNWPTIQLITLIWFHVLRFLLPFSFFVYDLLFPTSFLLRLWFIRLEREKTEWNFSIYFIRDEQREFFVFFFLFSLYNYIFNRFSLCSRLTL